MFLLKSGKQGRILQNRKDASWNLSCLLYSSHAWLIHSTCVDLSSLLRSFSFHDWNGADPFEMKDVAIQEDSGFHYPCILVGFMRWCAAPNRSQDCPVWLPPWSESLALKSNSLLLAFGFWRGVLWLRVRVGGCYHR